ncbi:MAG: hypothetical protein WB919_05460 [Candidatus Sulfotelmatobacter sp.]
MIIAIAIGAAVMISAIRGRLDPARPNFAYCLLMVLLVVSLAYIVRSGLDRSIPMSRTSRAIRVVGASLWGLAIVAGMAIQVWNAIHR